MTCIVCVPLHGKMVYILSALPLLTYDRFNTERRNECRTCQRRLFKPVFLEPKGEAARRAQEDGGNMILGRTS
jgi:hypothetical protein